MFNTPQPIANPARYLHLPDLPNIFYFRDNIVSLLANELYFQPCYTVERTNGYRYFKDRLWGMMHVLKKCQVRSSVVLPSDPYNNKNNAMLEMEFIQNSTFTSYTKHFHDISMEMKAKKAEVNEPYRIYRITEVCSDQ
uniref:PAZ domain-containing protein n=1 Tax=Caenorhabditis tropicalis TaxID=1561998 RepID=A0A1I7UXU6_9PELO